MPVVDARAAIEEEREALGLVGDKQANALCLSGGGIRSAAFGLGVVQGFAEAGLLKRFHYLSTVSGGGYIGGWLTRLIASANETVGTGGPIKLESVEALLAKRYNGFEIPELRALRRYTNYLAPSLGPLSADLWAGIVLWIRNTLINWLVFAPLFVAMAALPAIYALLIVALGSRPPSWSLAATLPESIATAVACALAAAAPVMFGIMIYRTIVELPSHSFPPAMEPPPPKADFGKSGLFLNRHIVRWALIWSILAPLAAVPILHMTSTIIATDLETLFGRALPSAGGGATTSPTAPSVGSCKAVQEAMPSCAATPSPDPAPLAPRRHIWLIVLAALPIFVSGMIAYVAAWRRVATWEYGTNAAYRERQLRPFRANVGAWTAGCAVSAALDGLGLYVGVGVGPITIAIFGPLWVVGAEILRSTLYIALRTDALRGDLDREWSARLNGAKLSWVLVYTVGAILVLAGPGYVAANVGYWIAIAGGGAASGTLAALLGKSTGNALAARRSDGTPLVRVRVLINAAIVVFGASLAMIAGRFSAIVAERLAEFIEHLFGSGASPAEPTHGLVVLGVLAVISYVSWRFPDYLSRRINLNNFSMHAVYRNRLVRAFLGTARSPTRWRPDRYTHFDPRDDVRMAGAFDNRSPKALFPVVNVALNRTSGKDMARAERKAMPFTITPYRCGFANPTGRKPRRGFYARTEVYAGNEREYGPADGANGISLGTAIALSGAAASPNMGYHSSPLAAFVMTLFNVRLGAWLPNPAYPDADEHFLRTADADGIAPMMNEIVGRSDAMDRYVYLSDGGHFDNLALYEMLRRRCRYMVVVDAGQDEGYAYADLRMLIQHASTDLDIKVAFNSVQQVGERRLRDSGAVAHVTYPAVADGPLGARREEKGTILYLKPWLSPDAPMALRAFQVIRPDFPHEPTTNQFFTESDFESYRELGCHIATMALSGYASDIRGKTEALSPDDIEMDRLFASLSR